MSNITFSQLGLIEPINRALTQEGYTYPTPIQEQSIPYLLTGGDFIGCAQTGTGKTAAFSLPMLQRLSESGQAQPRKAIRALILTPTRELAIQIGESITTYGGFLQLKHAVIFGGVNEKPQIEKLKRGLDILVATPGRLLDLMNQGFVDLRSVEIFVLDEADRMLDMGFIRDVKKVLQKLPAKRQTLLFSATMPSEIEELAATILHKPKRVSVVPAATIAEKIEEWVMFVAKDDKLPLLKELLGDPTINRLLIFTRTKHGANRLSEQLDKSKIKAGAIHGNKSQNARQKALAEFRDGTIRVLVATDIFARGIDIDGISHVVNYELPNEPESYVHRIGRTARAGASGVAISFCDADERAYLVDIEKIMKRNVPIVEEHPYRLDQAANDHIQNKRPPAPPKRNQGRSGPPRGNGNGRGKPQGAKPSGNRSGAPSSNRRRSGSSSRGNSSSVRG